MHTIAAPLARARASAPKPSQVRRFASAVYDAQPGRAPAHARRTWRLSLTTVVVVVCLLVFGSSPWKWAVLPTAAALLLLGLPLVVRWSLRSLGSATAFRERFRSQP
jgi:hypothetical protein